MTEQKITLAEIFAACWRDEALKARFMTDPRSVLEEHGLEVPSGVDLKVVENADDCVHITLPAPPAGVHELSDDDLLRTAGGVRNPNHAQCSGLSYLVGFCTCHSD